MVYIEWWQCPFFMCMYLWMYLPRYVYYIVLYCTAQVLLLASVVTIRNSLVSQSQQSMGKIKWYLLGATKPHGTMCSICKTLFNIRLLIEGVRKRMVVTAWTSIEKELFEVCQLVQWLEITVSCEGHSCKRSWSLSSLLSCRCNSKAKWISNSEVSLTSL